MADHTKIEWTEATWTPIRARTVEQTGKVKIGWHCEHASEGCRFCYAEGFNRRLGTGLDYKPGHLRGNVELFLDQKMLTQPLRWKKPRQIFVCSMTDLFADFVPDEWIDQVFAVMALCPQHTFQVLTKRSARMRAYFANSAMSSRINTVLGNSGVDVPAWSQLALLSGEPLPNVWLGVSVENQAAADERIPDLLATPAAVRWLSCEPLLGPVDLECTPWPLNFNRPIDDVSDGIDPLRFNRAKIDWVVVGGESGDDARPMHPDWARSLRDQCEAAGTPFFFKQWGNWAPGEIAGEHLDPDKPAKGASFYNDSWHDCWSEPEMHVDDEPDVYRISKKAAGRLLDGKMHDAMPARP